jgi:hypothetical protein
MGVLAIDLIVPIFDHLVTPTMWADKCDNFLNHGSFLLEEEIRRNDQIEQEKSLEKNNLSLTI